MHIGRRTCLLAATIAALASIAAQTSRAQDRYPARPITLVLPYAAGGGTDAIARVFARALEERLGGIIVVENRPGAGGNIATDARGPCGGRRLHSADRQPGADGGEPAPLQDHEVGPRAALEPITLIANASLVIVVGPAFKAQTLKELIEEAKRRPEGLTYASASHASASHLAALLLERAAGIKARHVAYRGASPALSDVVGGHVDFMITTIPSATGLINGGKLKALAVTGAARTAVLPDVPTAAEAGVRGLHGVGLVRTAGAERLAGGYPRKTGECRGRGLAKPRVAGAHQGRRCGSLRHAHRSLSRLHGRRAQALGRGDQRSQYHAEGVSRIPLASRAAGSASP